MPELEKEAGWSRVAFGDVVRQVQDRVDPEESGLERFVAGEHMDTDDLRIRRWGQVGDGYLGPAFHMRFKPGHILYGSRRTYLRKVAAADFEGITANTTYVLEPKDPNVLLPELLPFIMQTHSFNQHSVRESKGSVNPYVNFSDLAWYEFALPPIEEQRRLASALKAADALGEQLLRVKSASDLALNSLTHASFTEPTWPQQLLGELLEHASDGPFGSKIKTEHYSPMGARVVRLNNVDMNRFDDDDKVFLPLEYFTSSLHSYHVHPGDVIVAGLGDEGTPAGRACVVPSYLGPAVNKADCFCLRPGPKITPQYLAFFLNSPIGLAQSAAYSQGTTRQRLNLENIKAMMVPVPGVAAQENLASHLMSLLQAKEKAALRQRCASNLRTDLLRLLLESQSVV